MPIASDMEVFEAISAWVRIITNITGMVHNQATLLYYDKILKNELQDQAWNSGLYGHQFNHPVVPSFTPNDRILFG